MTLAKNEFIEVRCLWDAKAFFFFFFFCLGNMRYRSGESLQSIDERCIQISFVGGLFPIALCLDQVMLMPGGVT